MTASVQEALSESSLPYDEMLQTYGPFFSLANRLLGAPPKFLSLAHDSPTTNIFFLSAFRPCFRIPECDMSLLRITPSLRRAALLESSIAHNCPYCVGHMAALGDVVRGPLSAQCAWKGNMEPAATGDCDIVKAFVREVCTIPGNLSKITKEQFVAEYGEEGYIQLASMICFMGFLNFTMNAGGMRLESRMLPFAEAAIEDRSLPFEIRDNIDGDNEEHLGVEEVENVRTHSFWESVLEYAKNAWGLVGLIGPAASAGLAEMRTFGNIPRKIDELDAWCAKKLGTTPDVFESVTDPVLKRSLGLSVRLLFVDDDPLWTREQKCMFLYVLATGIMNDRLQEDALKLYNVKGPNGADEATIALSIATSPEKPMDAYQAALKFVHQCAGNADRVTEETVNGLVEHVRVHRSIVDLVGIIGHFGFWHRASIFYPKDEQ